MTIQVNYWRNYYDHCGEKWDSEDDCKCNDECPICGAEVKPFHSVELTDEVEDLAPLLNDMNLPVTMANPSQSTAALSLALAAEEGMADKAGQFLNLLNNAVASDIVHNYLSQVKVGDLTPEEGAVKANAEADKRHTEQHLLDLKPYFQIAEKWANKSHLTISEACHGVARDAYKHRIEAGRPAPIPEGFSPGQAYSDKYDRNKAEDIRARLTRSAREIFD